MPVLRGDGCFARVEAFAVGLPATEKTFAFFCVPQDREKLKIYYPLSRIGIPIECVFGHARRHKVQGSIKLVVEKQAELNEACAANRKGPAAEHNREAIDLATKHSSSSTHSPYKSHSHEDISLRKSFF